MTQQQTKMLSIDDRMLTTDLDRAGYRSMGITVRHATNFAEAQQILNSEKVDIIVINLDYEKIDALGICKHFKSHDPIKKIPIVITSVQTTAAARNSANAAGADLFVEQPLPRQYFIEKLKKLLDQITRSNDRVSLEESVTITFKNKETTFPVGDLSASGMLVSADLNDIPDGAKVELSFCVPGQKKPIQAKGIVVRRIKANGTDNQGITGVGIRFESFMGDSEKRLERYVVKVADKEGKMIYYL